MAEYLKGNYVLPPRRKPKAKPKPRRETVEQQFERRALERLGGSIAFVMKGKTFVWNGDVDADEQAGQEPDQSGGRRNADQDG